MAYSIRSALSGASHQRWQISVASDCCVNRRNVHGGDSTEGTFQLDFVPLFMIVYHKNLGVIPHFFSIPRQAAYVHVINVWFVIRCDIVNMAHRATSFRRCDCNAYLVFGKNWERHWRVGRSFSFLKRSFLLPNTLLYKLAILWILHIFLCDIKWPSESTLEGGLW